MPSKPQGNRKTKERSPEKPTTPLVVGITGNIGCGKSTATRLFSELGVPTFDTDKVGHELLESDRTIRQRIVKIFGSEVVTDGVVDRRALGKVVFADPGKRRALEAIMHPAIMSAVMERARDASGREYVIVEVPLLYEAELADKFDYVLLVKADEKTAVERASANLGIDRDEVRRRLRTQIPQSEKEKLSDFVIANNGTRDELKGKVELLHSVLLSLSSGIA